MKEMMGILKIDENNNVTYEQNHEVDTNRLKEFFFYAIAQFVIHKNVNEMTKQDARFVFDALSFMNEVSSCANAKINLGLCPPIRDHQLESKACEIGIAQSDEGHLIFVSDDKELQPMHMLVVIGGAMGCLLALEDRIDVYEQIVETSFQHAYQR